MHSGCTFAANVKHTVDWEFALHSSFIRCATGLIIFFFSLLKCSGERVQSVIGA